MVETVVKIGRVIRIDKKHSSSRERNGEDRSAKRTVSL